jgi:hypothetical protein
MSKDGISTTGEYPQIHRRVATSGAVSLAADHGYTRTLHAASARASR